MKAFIRNLSQGSIRSIIALIIVIGVLVYMFCLLFCPIPPGNKEIVSNNNGLISGIILATLAYYFGASKDKTDSDKQDKVTITNPNVSASVTAPNINEPQTTK
jgi:succinate-acetate transporter protein